MYHQIKQTIRKGILFLLRVAFYKPANNKKQQAA